MNSILIALGIRSSILLIAGSIFAILLRKSSAASRNAIWRLTFLGLLLMPIMLVRLPKWEVPVEQVPVVNNAVRYVEALPSQQAPTASVVDVAKPATPKSTPHDRPLDWSAMFVWAWFAISGFALAPLLVGIIVLIRTIRRSTPIEMLLVNALCEELSIRRKISIRVSGDIQTPATAGFLRPMVIIPNEALNWAPERMEMVLRHELAHIQRSDWLFRILAHLACALYAPNPLVWLACARLRSESEAACDDLVLAGGVNAKSYAQELLTIARDVRRTNFGLATIGIAHRSNVEARLRAIVDPRRRRKSLSRRAFISLTLCGLLTAGVIASLHLVAASRQKSNPTAQTAQEGMEFLLKGMRDDVPDHPEIPPVQRGAKFTVEPYQPKDITVAINGVAHLPSGITITLTGIAPASTSSPVWNIENQDVQGIRMDRSGPVAGYGDGTYVEALDRNLYFLIDSPKSAKASTIGYLVKPQPKSYKIKGTLYAPFGQDIRSNTFALGRNSLHTASLWIPGPPITQTATYRVGVGTGEWKSVMDVTNPYHGPTDSPKADKQGAGGGVILNGIPCIIGPTEPGKKLPPNDRFVGTVNASDAVARRALILDANGDLIRGLVSHQVGWYPLSYDDIRRCTHIVIQERPLEWAEFRDIPLRPTLDHPAETRIHGSAKGIAPGFLKTVPGLGTVAISEVVTTHKVGNAWTDENQPAWRADGKVLSDEFRGREATVFASTPSGDPITDIRLQYSGEAWHTAYSKLRIEGDQAPFLQLPSQPPTRIYRAFDKRIKQVTVLLDIADGPWQVLESKQIDLKPLPDVPPGTRDSHTTGLILLDGERPRLLVLDHPTDMTTANLHGEDLKPMPANSAHRFVAVLRDGSENVLREGFSIQVPDRRGESPGMEEMAQVTHKKFFLASDVKEIRYEVRPISKTIRFENVQLKPKY